MINQDGNKVFSEVDSAEQLLGYRWAEQKLIQNLHSRLAYFSKLPKPRWLFLHSLESSTLNEFAIFYWSRNSLIKSQRNECWLLQGPSSSSMGLSSLSRHPIHNSTSSPCCWVTQFVTDWRVWREARVSAHVDFICHASHRTSTAHKTMAASNIMLTA